MSGDPFSWSRAELMNTWKAPHIVKGILTYVPVLNTWRSQHATSGGSGSARYCYAVWLRHLITLERLGFRVKGAQVGELGPGDSLGVGLSALLSGADSYVGLDAMPFSRTTGLETIFNELVQLFSQRAPIPSDEEFPRLRPKMTSQAFPDYAIDFTGFTERVERVRHALRAGVNKSPMLRYRAPWTAAHVSRESLDLVLSQGVLQCVDGLQDAYRHVCSWLKPGGFSSHGIGCAATYLSPFWNGHWAYSDREWQLVRGKREYLLNREPFSAHLEYARKAGFTIVEAAKEYGEDGLPIHALSARYRSLDPEDQRTRFVMLVLQKPR
jgi:hypothetical protein